MEDSYNRLERSLLELLDDREHKVFSRAEGELSLLVLETPEDSAGFTIVDGTPEQKFNSAYSEFKALYRARHKLWRNRNLSFIVCRSDSQSQENNDEFFSRIESDTYFCKKYVVRFPESSRDLIQELRRLPFVPMYPYSDIGLRRPSSAIDLLQSLEIDTDITRYLIEPQRRAPRTLLTDVLTKPQVLPQRRRIQPIHPSRTNDVDVTRITQIAIEGFRAYGQRVQIDTEADVVVFYGPNGLGKTTLFDAVDFACTGRIGRLERQRKVSNPDFIRLANHRGTSETRGRVKIRLARGQDSVSLAREVNDRNNALVGHDKLDRGQTIQRVTSAKWGPKRERIENLERLFRATHFFSQTSPELFSKFEQACTLSSELVARTLALEDYARGIWKAKEVLKLTSAQMASLRSRDVRLREEIENLHSRAVPYRVVVDEVEPGEQLRGFTGEVVEELKDVAGLDVDIDSVTPKNVREWRAIVDGRLETVRRGMERLDRVAEGWEEYRESVEIAEVLSRQRSELKALTRNTKETVSTLQETESRISAESADVTDRLREIKARTRSLAEAAELLDRRQSAVDALEGHRAALTRLDEKEISAKAEINKLSRHVKLWGGEARAIEKEITVRTARIRLLVEIDTGAVAWKEAVSETNRWRNSVAKVDTDVESVTTAIYDVEQHIGNLTKRFDIQDQEFRDLTEGQRSINRILNELEALQEGSKCLVCGADHGTMENLLSKMDDRRRDSSPQIIELGNALRDLANVIERHREPLRELKSKRRALEKDRDHAINMIRIKRREVQAFEELVTAAGLPEDTDSIINDVPQLIAHEESEVGEKKKQLALLKDDESKAATGIEKLVSEDLTVEQEYHRVSASALVEQIAGLEDTANELGVGIDRSVDSIAREEAALKVREGTLRERRLVLEKRDDDVSQQLSEVQVGLRALEDKIQICTEQQQEVSGGVKDYEDMVKSMVEVHGDVVTERDLQKAISSTQDRQQSFSRLQQRLTTLEKILDSAQRSATLVQIDADIADRVNRQSENGSEMESLRNAVIWFTRIKEILENQNADAIQSYVDSIGPLTTIIQKRLRSVHGFGDVRLAANKDVIEVSVEDWSGTDVRPTDYFSESQKQILTLSLFLSTRLTQTWSGFGAVFMDDPVTHFDDLNAFAFTELIRGLVSRGSEKHQFVISTCDQRLFELMKQKLSRTAGGAKFYVFEGLGRNGPVISED